MDVRNRKYVSFRNICFIKVHDRIGKQLTSMTLQQQPSLQNQQANDPSRVVGSYK
jgi:hypothetical protein